MRKILALTIALTLSVGAVFAEEIKAVFKKYDGGKLTVTVEEKEKTYDVDTSAKFKVKGKGGEEKEVTVEEVIKNEKRGFKEGDKITVTVKDEKVIKVERERGKKTDK